MTPVCAISSIICGSQCLTFIVITSNTEGNLYESKFKDVHLVLTALSELFFKSSPTAELTNSAQVETAFESF